MRTIKCCKDCVAPKRYPGCGAACTEYQKEKALLAEENKKLRDSRALGDYFHTEIERSQKRHKSRNSKPLGLAHRGNSILDINKENE